MIRAALLGLLLCVSAAKADCDAPPHCLSYWASDAVVTATWASADRSGSGHLMAVHDILQGDAAPLVLVTSRQRIHPRGAYLLYLRDSTRWDGRHVPGVAGPGPLLRTFAAGGECSASKPLRSASGAELDYVMRDARRADGEGTLEVQVVLPSSRADPVPGTHVGTHLPVRGVSVRLRSADAQLRESTGVSGWARFRAPVGRYVLSIDAPDSAHPIADASLVIGYEACLRRHVTLAPR